MNNACIIEIHESGGRGVGQNGWYLYKDRVPGQGSTLGKSPPLQGIDVTDPIKSNFELYEEVLDAAPLEIYGSNI